MDSAPAPGLDALCREIADSAGCRRNRPDDLQRCARTRREAAGIQRNAAATRRLKQTFTTAYRGCDPNRTKDFRCAGPQAAAGETSQGLCRRFGPRAEASGRQTTFDKEGPDDQVPRPASAASRRPLPCRRWHMVTAITTNCVEEAPGVTRAAQRASTPVAISFTVETDGRPPTGQTLRAAIEQVDAETSSHPPVACSIALTRRISRKCRLPVNPGHRGFAACGQTPRARVVRS
jgi:hypothetical protein